ncbi:glutaredoxin family protein [uncultured Oxalicibacterium sp.]|uniref:glutaredoxin family protein n=1 Tax=uncultured Oxalicibacterium sp. TaxID=1168540 RepID=UPI0025CE0529|nr:glutaredoxin family protein [uncultured Oxalicibacterium sp.]
MHQRSSLLLLSLLLSASAHAQMYKSVGPDGKVTYGDTPPAKTGKVEEKNLPATSASTQLPFELAEAVRKHPVTLYTSRECSGCDMARTALSTRGVPYTEKTVQTNEDVARLKQIAGNTQLPLLVAGNLKETGFEQDAWNKTLTAAGYPVNSQLPRTYRNPPPQPAAPMPAKAAAPDAAKPAAESSTERSTETPPAAGKAPPNFRF